MEILAIDPGPEVSGAVVYNSMGKTISAAFPSIDNNELLMLIDSLRKSTDYMVIEWVSSYGMPVGESVFSTAEWVGRFRQVYGINRTRKIKRYDVKQALCHNAKARDANIRQALIDCFPGTGVGKVPQIGSKKSPGPLYGISKHAWAALALAVVFSNGG